MLRLRHEQGFVFVGIGETPGVPDIEHKRQVPGPVAGCEPTSHLLDVVVGRWWKIARVMATRLPRVGALRAQFRDPLSLCRHALIVRRTLPCAGMVGSSLRRRR
jgi:hypothetical protein